MNDPEKITVNLKSSGALSYATFCYHGRETPSGGHCSSIPQIVGATACWDSSVRALTSLDTELQGCRIQLHLCISSVKLTLTWVLRVWAPPKWTNVLDMWSTPHASECDAAAYQGKYSLCCPVPVSNLQAVPPLLPVWSQYNPLSQTPGKKLAQSSTFHLKGSSLRVGRTMTDR